MKLNGLKKFSGLAVTALACVALGGCAANQAQRAGYNVDAEIYDPLESYNRGMTSVNEALDKAILEPGARVYRYVTPRPVRLGVRNVLRQLRTPLNVANQTLQGDVEGAAKDVSRFMVNTIAGFGGMIDVADTMGLKYEPEDFGQTMAVWGMGHGAYFVLPVVGPSSLRDTTGLVVDSFADPVRICLFNTDREVWHYGRVGMTALSTREELLEAIDDLRKNSFDYYAALRSAYYQKRAALVRDDDAGGGFGSGVEAIPDYDD